MNNRTLRTGALVLVVIIALAALAFAAYHFFSYQKIAPKLLPKGTQVTFVEQGRPQHYTVDNNKLVPDPLFTREDGIVVFEEVPSPLDASSKIVLAALPGVRGIVLGAVHADDTFEVLVSGETRKADLIVREDGTVVVAVSNMAGPVATPDDFAGGAEFVEEPAEDDVVIEGFAEGPGEPAPFEGYGLELTPYLIKYDLRTETITPLGLGRTPRLLSDGTILALSPEGIVRIRVEDGATTLVFARPAADALRGGISPSGSLIALEAADGKSTDFYRYDTVGEGGLAHLGMLTFDGIVTGFAFVDDERFFIRTGPQVVRLYYTPTVETAVALPIAIMGVAANR